VRDGHGEFGNRGLQVVGVAGPPAVPPGARWGIDLSDVMLSQAKRPNLAEVMAGRLTLIRGSASALSGIASADIVMTNHVLYFWHQPAAEMGRIHHCLRPGGLLALGYRLWQEMPAMAQKRFPQYEHLLYDSDDEVDELTYCRPHRRQPPDEGPA
jgi:SAM-dependent methyltransferase